MAHSFWGLAEIVRAIAANLVSDKTKSSAVALASCCKSLEEPALAEVWRSLSSLAPLIKSFPPEIWEIEFGLLSFKRAPLCAEWARFQQYASKVRHLETTEEISWAVLHMLQQLSDYSPILPNLMSLSWDGDNDFIPWVSPFISRSLTSITLKVPCEAPLMLAPILRRLSTFSPYLRDIKVQTEDMHHYPSMIEASSQLLMQCNPNRLRKYNVDAPMSASALRHAIQLPSLESFWLIFDSSTCHLPNPLPVVVFPNLQKLDVQHSGGDHAWLNLLPAIENPVLSTISVRCSGPDVVQFMETFQETVTGCGMKERLKVFKLRSQEEFMITPHILACNFPFKNLTTLHVLSPCSDVCQTADLEDGDVDLLTKALPRLESLMLGERPCNFPSKITFKSLYTISHRCTRLTTLQIHFDPSSLIANAEAWDVALGLTNFPLSDLCSVKTLDVGKITLVDECSTAINTVALGLVGVFPLLENLENTWYRAESDWEQVNDLIKACRRMGRFALHNLNK